MVLQPKKAKTAARHNANVMVQEAENNFGPIVVNKACREIASKEADEAAGIASPSRGHDPERTASIDISDAKGEELKAVITCALPDATADRCDLILMGMLIEELTVPRLVVHVCLSASIFSTGRYARTTCGSNS